MVGLLLCQACSGVVQDGAPGSAAGVPPRPGAMVGAGPGPAGVGGPAPACQATAAGLAVPPAPLRRLTRYEFNNTVRDLLGDATSPANALPAEEQGNGFGNDAAGQSVSSLLAEQYAVIAEGIAARATQTPGRLAPCAASVTAATEESCARSFIAGFVPRAFRRPLAPAEADELLALHRSIRALEGASFVSALAGIVEAVLQSPDFLYRVERPDGARPSGDELATRLSYFLWGTMPDEALRAAARDGQLLTAAGVAAQASRLLADPRARATVRFFFDNLLPIGGLSDLERAPALHPTFTPAIGALMREETQRLLEHTIFEEGGTWSSALTAPYTFVNGPLAAFYKMPAGQGGAAFRKVPLDTTRRLGFLTQGGVMAGTTHSNHTNPVVRGSFVAQKLLCLSIPLPDASIAEQVKPPDPYSGKTARERFGKHQADPVCKSCHALMDPIGLALENFDAVGLERTHENGELIDASGSVPGAPGTIDGPVALSRTLAGMDAAHGCFASHWLALAFGRTLGPADQCLLFAVTRAFEQSGYDVRKLLLAVTQTDAFLSLGGQGQ
jgi:hypothetical protein